MKNILKEMCLSEIIKRLLISVLSILAISLISMMIPHGGIDDYLSWTLYAFQVTLIAIVITLGLDIVFYKSEVLRLVHKINGIINSFLHR